MRQSNRYIARSQERAGDFAVMLAKATSARLSILTVAGHLVGYEMEQLARAERDIGDALAALLDQVLTDAKQRAQRAGVSDVKVHADVEIRQR